MKFYSRVPLRFHIPDRVEQLHPRDALAAVEHQVLQQGKFLVGEHNGLSGAPGRMLQPVQFQVAGAQGQPRLPLAAQQSAAPRPQFVQAERFRHQIVGPAVEAPHPRVHLLPRGQHHHRKIGAHQANLVEDAFSVLHRQIQIQNGQVGQILAERLHGGASIERHPDAMPVGLQPASQKQPQRLVIFGDQQSHGSLSHGAAPPLRHLPPDSPEPL